MIAQQRRSGLLVVLSGPSGVGKDVAIARLKQQGFAIHYVVTATTRPRRPNERHGIDYFFLSREEFEDLIARDELLEWSWVHGNLYGPPLAQVRETQVRSPRPNCIQAGRGAPPFGGRCDPFSRTGRNFTRGGTTRRRP